MVLTLQRIAQGAVVNLGKEEELGLAHAPPSRHVGGLTGQQARDVIAACQAPGLLRFQHCAQQARSPLHYSAP